MRLPKHVHGVRAIVPLALVLLALVACATASASKPKVDSGRMSASEYKFWFALTDKFDREMATYGAGLGGKCAVLMKAVQLKDASDCIHDAWSGVWNAGLAAYSESDDLMGDTIKTCRVALAGFKTRLSLFASAHNAAEKAIENLQFDEFTSIAKVAAARRPAYIRASAKVRRTCSPT